MTATVITLCDTCRGRITWMGHKQLWAHLDQKIGRPAPDHEATPELRFAIDATCPNCGHPELGKPIDRDEFICSRCEHVTTERPER